MNDYIETAAVEGGATPSGGGSQPASPIGSQVEKLHESANDGGAISAKGGAIASDKKPGRITDERTPWPPRGDAIRTTAEARLHLLREHDIFLDERYVQKQLNETGKLTGRRVPRDGGGSKWEILLSSLDAFAKDQKQKKVTDYVVVKVKDNLFDAIRAIVENKPYEFVIEGDAPPALPTVEQPSAVEEDDHEEKETEKPAPAPAVEGDAVPREFYDQVVARAERAEKLHDDERERSEELTDKLHSTNEKVIELSDSLIDLAKEQPKSLFSGLTDMFKARRGILDDEVLPAGGKTPDDDKK